MHAQSGASLSIKSPAAGCVLGLLEDRLQQAEHFNWPVRGDWGYEVKNLD